ncbi:unnamed protein product [Withania somnifera]
MEEQRKRSDEPNLDLCLKTPSEVEVEPTKKVPTLNEAMNLELKHDLPNLDVKKLRRLRRIEYITKLEKTIKDLQDTIASVGPKIENVKDNKKKLQLENEMLQEQLDRVTDKSNLGSARTEELKLELKRLRKLEKAQKDQGHVQAYDDDDDDDESVAEIDMDQYLNFDAINFYPFK